MRTAEQLSTKMLDPQHRHILVGHGSQLHTRTHEDINLVVGKDLVLYYK
jgi:hypothetical protein